MATATGCTVAILHNNTIHHPYIMKKIILVTTIAVITLILNGCGKYSKDLSGSWWSGVKSVAILGEQTNLTLTIHFINQTEFEGSLTGYHSETTPLHGTYTYAGKQGTMTYDNGECNAFSYRARNNTLMMKKSLYEGEYFEFILFQRQ